MKAQLFDIASGVWDTFEAWDWRGYWDIPSLQKERPPELGYCTQDDPQTAYADNDLLVINKRSCEEAPAW